MKIEPQILERLKRQREEGLADMKRHGRNAWWCFIVAVVLAPLPVYCGSWWWIPFFGAILVGVAWVQELQAWNWGRIRSTMSTPAQFVLHAYDRLDDDDELP